MKPKKIIIVGGGVEGWTVAALLGRHLPPKLVEVFVIEHPVTNMIIAESAGSRINSFHQLLGVKEKTLLAASNTTYRTGVRYSGWSSHSQQYVLSEGRYGDTFRGIDFHQLYAKSLQLGVRNSFDEYSINSVSAKLNRCASPVSNQQSIYSCLVYGMNLQADVYAKVLKENAISAGVTTVTGAVKRVALDSESGHISAVHLDNGEVFAADFFIDCSGREGVLIDGGLGVASISQDCLFNRAAVGNILLEEIGSPTANLGMHNHGFIKQVLLKDKSILTYNFSSRYLTDERAEQYLNELGVVNVSFQDKHCERRSSFWYKNCVAIGLAAASHYDIYYSPLQTVRNSAVRLLDLLMVFDDFESVSSEYNRQSFAEHDCIEALNQLHLYLAKSQSAILHDYFKSNQLTEYASHKLNLFSLTGKLAYSSEDIFTKSEWIAFFLGNNIAPETYNNEIDFLGDSDLIKFIERIRVEIYKAAEKVPRHVDFIANVLNG
ncbi:MAG: tryptophan 7-halogenase [Pseudomonadota bacterium]